MTKENSPHKVHKNNTKSSISSLIPMSIVIRFCCLISVVFDYKGNTRNFPSLTTSSFSSLTWIFQVFILFVKTNNKCNTKVKHICCELKCSTLSCTFSRGALVPIFNLRYTWYLVKDLIFSNYLSVMRRCKAR